MIVKKNRLNEKMDNKKIEHVKPAMERLIMSEQDYISKNKTQLDKIVKGWYPPSLEEKKRDLAKKGIRDLQRTCGSLITRKGHIDGYLSAFGIPWGKISFTPEQAEKAMGFRPKEGSTGVVLSRRKYIDENGKVKFGIFAISLTPRQNTPTEKMQRTNERTRVLGKIAHYNMKDIIYPIWEPLVTDKSRKPWSGYHYFMSVNLKNIGSSLNWSKLLVSKGKLESPKRVPWNWYDAEKGQIHIILSRRQAMGINEIGIGILDILTGDFFHISPMQVSTYEAMELSRKAEKLRPLELNWELKQVKKYHPPKETIFRKWNARFYIYIYYKRQNNSNYSASICAKMKASADRRMERNSPSIVITCLMSN